MDHLISTEGTYTYVSDAWGSHSWLDHLISTEGTYTYVSDAWGSHSWLDHLISTEGTYTYVSDTWGSHSWLDHLISTEDGNNVITNMCVLYYGNVHSDHIPVAVNIDLQLAPDIDHGAVPNIGNTIDWSALSEDQSEIRLRNVELPTDVLRCKDCKCTEVKHKEALNKYYDDIICAITSAGQNTIEIRKPYKGNNLN